jgi:serine/threonine-protein kinase
MRRVAHRGANVRHPTRLVWWVYRESVEGMPFGRYQLIELLGRGGMGEVWRARDTAIERIVALKMLLPVYATDPEYEKRFRREAHAAARLDDPHIVPIYDIGEIDGRLYLTMRLINGTDLQTLLTHGPLEPQRAVAITNQIASALHHAHQNGLVHRDVKPSNILLTDTATGDFAYLIDFGIARATTDTALTNTHTTIGTWAYMAPERFNSNQTTPSSDIYALACVLYQCLTGHPPYPGDTLEQIAVGHMVAPPPHPSDERPTIPTALDHVITTGLAKQPTDRYPTALDMAHAAQQAITTPTTTQTPPTTTHHRRPAVVVGALAAASLLVAGAVVAVTYTRDDHRSTAPPSTAPTATPNTGPFTGTYRADFGPVTSMAGVEGTNAKPSVATYGIRSVCRQTGCVATGSRLSGDASFAQAVELDDVNGIWLAVTLASQQCRDNARAESWQVFKLRPQPGGTLVGEFVAAAGNSCASKYTVTFTRTGDVDVDSLPDPANLAPRVVSPAEALRGSYRQVRTFSSGQRQQDDFVVDTYCVRTGDRCMSYFHQPAGGVEPLIFADGSWSLATDLDDTCPGVGATVSVKKTAQFPLPHPTQNPITLLTGHGVQEQSQPCAVTIEFDETFTRTGD